RLCGAVVSKVFQMSPEDLLLRLWRHQDLRLLLSTQASGPRLHLTTARFRNPPHLPRFAALLRAHLTQVRLCDITVQPYDRVVALEQLQQQGAFDAVHVQRLVVGLAPVLATELVHRSQGEPQRCWELLQELRQHYEQGTLALSICTTPQGTRHLSALPLTHCP